MIPTNKTIKKIIPKKKEWSLKKHKVKMFIEAINNNIENFITEKIHFRNQTSVFSKKDFI